MTPMLRRACHTPVLSEQGLDLPVVALVGRPNVGKSTLFGVATGRFAETVNAPGTTVAAERRLVHFREGDAYLVDLPGTLSLDDSPAGSEPFWRGLVDARPDAVLVVGDAGDLRRHLPLALACRDLGLPIVFAANLADEAEARGIDLDAGRLSQLLAAPVHVTTSRSGRGVGAAVAQVVSLARQRRARLAGAAPRGTVPARVYGPQLELQLDALARTIVPDHSLGAAAFDATGLGLGQLVGESAISARGAASLQLGGALESARWGVAADWATQVERRRDVPIRLADKIAVWSTSLWPGLPIFFAVTAILFGTMMWVGGTLSTLLTSAWGASVSPVLGTVVHSVIPQPVVAAGLLWGLDGGMLGLLSVGIPYILTFYLLLAFLEDSGYLTSAAVLTDRLFNTLGLPGRAAIPILAASGCNVPAIYGTRVLPTRRERLLGAFLVTMTPCSARSAVVVAAVAPFAGPVAAVGAFGLIAAITFASGLAANALVPGRQPALVLELAPIRRPIARQVVRKAWRRFSEFVRTAAPIMLIGSVALGLLYESGLIWYATAVLDPVVRGWLGLPSVAGLALVFAFLRKELALQLLVALAVIQLGAGAAGLGSIMSPAQLFVYAIVTSVSVPCVATLAALRGEFGWRPALAMCSATLGIALAAGGILARLLGTA
jgi:ferrous iron transport protein B